MVEFENWGLAVDAVNEHDALLQAMREWGSEEDGILDFACSAYDRAAIAVGQMPLPSTAEGEEQ